MSGRAMRNMVGEPASTVSRSSPSTIGGAVRANWRCTDRQIPSVANAITTNATRYDHGARFGYPCG